MARNPSTDGDYQIWLLEYIAYKLSGTPLELGDFRDALEELYAGKYPLPSPGPPVRSDSGRGQDKGDGPDAGKGKGVLAWRPHK